MDVAVEEIYALLGVARGVGHARVGSGDDAHRRAIDRVVQRDVNLVVVVIGAGDEQRAAAEERVGPQELRVGAFLQA